MGWKVKHYTKNSKCVIDGSYKQLRFHNRKLAYTSVAELLIFNKEELVCFPFNIFFNSIGGFCNKKETHHN